MNVNLRREVIAGLTTFFTMSYIVVVNPSILSAPGTGMAFSGVLTATVLLCFLMTLAMGVYAKLPFAVAPGMGVNAFFTYTIILGLKVEALEDLVPAFLTLILIPLTFSITQGILWGLVLHTVFYCMVGRMKELSRSMIGIGLFSAGLLIMTALK